jgi:hypothetical protein
VSKVDLRLQCGMPCSKLEVSTVQHGTLSGAGYLHQSQWMGRNRISFRKLCGSEIVNPILRRSPKLSTLRRLRVYPQKRVGVCLGASKFSA